MYEDNAIIGPGGHRYRSGGVVLTTLPLATDERSYVLAHGRPIAALLEYICVHFLGNRNVDCHPHFELISHPFVGHPPMPVLCNSIISTTYARSVNKVSRSVPPLSHTPGGTRKLLITHGLSPHFAPVPAILKKHNTRVPQQERSRNDVPSLQQ